MGVFNFNRTISDPKLEAVLARLCEKLGDLWTTHVVKLPYLVDLVASHVLGRRIMKSHHKAWELGVVTARAWGLVTNGRGGKYFEVYGDAYADGTRIKLTSAPPTTLDLDEKAIVDFVADEFGNLGSTELGILTKDLNPNVKKWGGQEIVELTEEAYELLPVWFGEDEADLKFLKKRFEEIKKNPGRMVSADGFLEVLAR